MNEQLRRALEPRVAPQPEDGPEQHILRGLIAKALDALGGPIPEVSVADKAKDTERLIDFAVGEAKDLIISLDQIRQRRDKGYEPETPDKLEALREVVECIAMHEGLADS